MITGSDSDESFSSGDSEDDDYDSDESARKTPGGSRTPKTPSGGSRSATPKTPSGGKTPSSIKRSRRQQEDAMDMVRPGS